MAEVEGELENIEPLDNPWEKAAEHGARVFARSEALSKRVGSIATANLLSPEYAALERTDRETRDYLTSLAKLDIDDRRVRVTEVQRKQLGLATSHALDSAVTYMTRTLPPHYRNLPQQVRDVFIQALQQYLDSGGRDQGELPPPH